MLALEEDVQVAIETCPVDCIHWVSRQAGFGALGVEGFVCVWSDCGEWGVPYHGVAAGADGVGWQPGADDVCCKLLL